jgi:hypothetical protein
MSKLVIWIATTLVTLVFVFCVLAAIAAADELALLPFYHTLPISALLVNGTWLFFLLRKRGRVDIVSSPFTKLALKAAAFFTRPLRLRAMQPQYPSRSASSRAHNAGYRRGSPQEIQAALRKVHSVAWGFPRRTLIVSPMNQKEHANDEAHQ